MFDFERIESFLRQCNSAPNDIELRKVFATYHAEYDLRLPPDPFSESYHRRQLEIYETLAGRPYTPTNEVSDFDSDLASVSPFPYSNDSCELVGNQLIAIGFLIKHLGVRKGSKVLEFGPGWGNTTLALSKMGVDVTAVDIERNFCDLINKRAKLEQLKINVVNADFSHINTLRCEYDAVLFFECFHHAVDHQGLMAAFDRVVKPGGVVCFASEPITADFPIPWGLRMDGESIWAIRRNGWLELGFNERYFEQAMRRHGWNLTWHRGHDSPWASVVIASRNSESGGSYSTASGQLFTIIGSKNVEGAIVGSGQQGYLVFGPYIKLPRGKYRAYYVLERSKTNGVVEIDVSIANGNAVVAEKMINLRNLTNDELSIDFELKDLAEGLEVRVSCQKGACLTVSKLVIAPR